MLDKGQAYHWVAITFPELVISAAIGTIRTEMMGQLISLIRVLDYQSGPGVISSG